MENTDIKNLVEEYSSDFNYNAPETAIILAAGHGKRIKSTTSKMLHKIWEVPTVERVYNACNAGLGDINSIVVVGIKADMVVKAVGKRSSTGFAYQEVQNGTGHAVQVALEGIAAENYDGIVYVFPGAMGLIDGETLAKFRDDFKASNADMMVLTGLFEGDPADNAYGRIIRVKETDASGNSSEDAGKVIEIKEHKDILSLGEDELYTAHYKGKEYQYSRQELIENNEFNSGVYAFKFKKLAELIYNIDSDNAQGEIYITDMIGIFNQNDLVVDAVSPEKQFVLMGFNDKAVLTEMNEIARGLIYEKIKKIVYIDDPMDFYIHEDVVRQIVNQDIPGKPLDIRFGKGVYVGSGVKINNGLQVGKNSTLTGNIEFGKNVTIGENVLLNGKVSIGNGTTIGRNCQIIDSEIGNNVTVINSVLEGKSVLNESSEIIVIRNYADAAEGMEFVK